MEFSKEPEPVPSTSGMGEIEAYLPSPWTSLVAQLIKNPPAMRETWALSLGWEDPLEKRKGYPLQQSGLENCTDHIVHGIANSWTRQSKFHFTSLPSPFFISSIPHLLSLLQLVILLAISLDGNSFIPVAVLYYYTFKVLYYTIKNIFFFVFFLYYLCEKYYKPIIVQYYIANCAS